MAVRKVSAEELAVALKFVAAMVRGGGEVMSFTVVHEEEDVPGFYSVLNGHPHALMFLYLSPRLAKLGRERVSVTRLAQQTEIGPNTRAAELFDLARKLRTLPAMT